MQDQEAKNLLYRLIKENLLGNCRRAEDDHLKAVCLAWWRKTEAYKHYGSEVWEKCFNMAENRLGNVLKVFDFLAELNAFSPTVPMSEERKNEIPSTKAYMRFIQDATHSIYRGLPKIEMPADVKEEFFNDVQKMDKKTFKWWEEHYKSECEGR